MKRTSILTIVIVGLSIGLASAQATKDDLKLRAAKMHISTLNKQRLDYESKIIEMSLQLQEAQQTIKALQKQINKPEPKK